MGSSTVGRRVRARCAGAVSGKERRHRSIIAECVARLGRDLSEAETRFITSRGGFIALEMIEDTVKTLDSRALIEYLNSENE